MFVNLYISLILGVGGGGGGKPSKSVNKSFYSKSVHHIKEMHVRTTVDEILSVISTI